MKKIFGFVFLIISAVFLLWNFEFSLTGNVISDYFGENLLLHIIGIFFLAISIVLLGSRETLDWLVIPNSEGEWREERSKRWREEKKRRNVKKTYILKGADSEEDILLLGRKVKSGDRIGFDTFPLHYLEYKELIRKAIRDKKFPKMVHVENVRTKQDLKQTIYGVLGFSEELFRRRKLKYMKDRKPSKYYQKAKEYVKKLLS